MLERGPHGGNAPAWHPQQANTGGSMAGPSSAAINFAGAPSYTSSVQIPMLYAAPQPVVNLAPSAHLAAFPSPVFKPFVANGPPLAATAFFPTQYQLLAPVWPAAVQQQPAFLSALRPAGGLTVQTIAQRLAHAPAMPRPTTQPKTFGRQHIYQPAAVAFPAASGAPAVSPVTSAAPQPAETGQAPSTEQDVVVECSGWGCLIEGVLQIVVKHVAEPELKNFRLVCQHWRYVVDQNLEVLTPKQLKAKIVITRFPRLHTLQLISCPNVRNRDLFILSQGALNLKTLNIGDETSKPWVTNRGLASIALITSITSLSLNDCNSLTNNGLSALNKLSNLVSLSLKNCKKITNNGLEVLQQNTNLTNLNLVGCVRISDKALAPIVKLKLASLHLGNTRVRDEGMGYIAKITTLTELHLLREDVTDAGLKQLTTLVNLQSLALQDCDITGDALTSVIPHFQRLTHLDLYKSWDFDDEQLAACLPFMGSLKSLDLRATWVSDRGLSQLAQLSGLRRLGLAPHLDLSADSLGIISVLTQLTALTVTGHVSYVFLSQITCLTNLRELNMSDEFAECQNMKDPISGEVIERLAEFTSLTSLDLSRRAVYEPQVNFLAQNLRRLRTLHLAGCPIPAADMLALERRYPHVNFVRQVPKLLQGCSNIRLTVT